MTDRFEWVPLRATIYPTLAKAAMAIADLMAGPSAASIAMTWREGMRFHRVDLKWLDAGGWVVQYTDHHSFIRFLRDNEAEA